MFVDENDEEVVDPEVLARAKAEADAGTGGGFLPVDGADDDDDDDDFQGRKIWCCNLELAGHTVCKTVRSAMPCRILRSHLMCESQGICCHCIFLKQIYHFLSPNS